jgi:hypothetical protein
MYAGVGKLWGEKRRMDRTNNMYKLNRTQKNCIRLILQRDLWFSKTRKVKCAHLGGLKNYFKN